VNRTGLEGQSFPRLDAVIAGSESLAEQHQRLLPLQQQIGQFGSYFSGLGRIRWLATYSQHPSHSSKTNRSPVELIQMPENKGWWFGKMSDETITTSISTSSIHTPGSQASIIIAIIITSRRQMNMWRDVSVRTGLESMPNRYCPDTS
jgi:hypothetical protein